MSISELPTGDTQAGREQGIHFLVNWAMPVLVAILTHFDSACFKTLPPLLLFEDYLKSSIFLILVFIWECICDSLGLIKKKNLPEDSLPLFKYNPSRDEILVLSEWKPLNFHPGR